ncbi:uncharacterized protein LOC106169495 [Lingula anatina]|uniref:Uncharacterized protein LOC106169495 n=1 Tax=Lingula anatina TaxID=7574 RepID=A0A1S3J1V0_LINAN|nr:uncharacterized protein LOC106169495 [Lingula anatina]|eukprot:XP_013404412.1 uncharacterized protein LOC106169495 [Lingula anatina]
MENKTDDNNWCCSIGLQGQVQLHQCGPNSKADPNYILPLNVCCKPIVSHCRRHHIRDISSEADLIKARAGLFNVPVEYFTVCPNHRINLGLWWRASANCQLCLQKGRKNKPLAERTVTLCQSSFLLNSENLLVPVGSAICSTCRKDLLQKMKSTPVGGNKEQNGKAENDDGLPCTTVSDESDLLVKCDMIDENFITTEPLLTVADEVRTHETLEAKSDTTDDLNTSQSMLSNESSQGSEWLPNSQEAEDKRLALDNFLEMCGVSPIKKTLQVSWELSSDRTKADYIIKSKKIINEVLNVLAPGQGNMLFQDVLNAREDDMARNTSTLEVIALGYRLATEWGTQRQILSLISDQYSLVEIRKYIPDLSKYKYTMARKHAQIVGHGQPLMKEVSHREHLSDIQIGHFLDFLMSPAVMSDVPFGQVHLKLSSGQKIDVPKMILNTVRCRAVEQYLSFCAETDFQQCASTSTYMRIIQSVEPSIRKCMRGLDNFAADGAKAFEDCAKSVAVLGRLGMGAEWTKVTQTKLSAAKQYLKMEYKIHVTKQSSVPDHCCQFALSDGSDFFSSHCDHPHDKSCDSCESLCDALASVNKAQCSDTIEYESQDQHDEIQYTLIQGQKAIEDWKKHVLRSVNQDAGKTETLTSLSDNEVFIERDWAMKFLPMVYRESQSKWFAKRGINWHISVASFKENEEICSHTFVHLFDNATQDSHTSNAVLYDTLTRLHNLKPSLQKAFIRSDNAGCFHSYQAIFGIHIINCVSPITISRADFSDPQGGKSICDRRAAHIKSTVRKYVNEGNDVRTASQFLEAVKNSNSSNISLISATPPPSSPSNVSILKQCHLKNISNYYNFQFSSNGIKIWKQHNIGEGQYILVDKCIHVNSTELKEIVVVDSFSRERRANQVHDRKAESATVSYATQSPHKEQNQQEESQEDCTGGLFTCPEPNCITTFTKHKNLLRHLDTGIHSTKAKVCLSDRVKISYATEIEQKCVQLPHVNTGHTSLNANTLDTGWALKSRREVKRFTEQQKEYLTQKFNDGERSGIKSNPEDVAIEMRSAKYKNGNRLFSIENFLSAAQIGSFFSRLSLLKRKRGLETVDEEDFEAANFEAQFDDLFKLARQ